MKLVSFENTFLQTAENFTKKDGDIFASLTIDCYPEDESVSGESIAEVFITNHGEIVVCWKQNAYRNNDSVNQLIENSKTELIKLYADDQNDAKSDSSNPTFIIKPNSNIAEIITRPDVKTVEDAICHFATVMDSDMNAYFHAEKLNNKE